MDIKGFNKGPGSTRTESGQRPVTVVKESSQQQAVRQASAAPRQDTVVLSTEAQALNRMQRQMDTSAPVNRDKVEALKAAISNGTYQVSSSRIADKMLSSDALF